MILLGKLALGIGGSLVLAGVYTIREGVIRIDADEFQPNGSHMHFWVPAAAVPMTLHFVPKEYLRNAGEEIQPWMPTVRALTKELKKFPDADLVEVRESGSHVQVRTRNGKLLIDVDDPAEKIHITCPIETMEDASGELVARSPGA
jgi:predicted RNA binding protein YcfA (HicA-like mRNA interferase family)